jgi:hypothetical protein
MKFCADETCDRYGRPLGLSEFPRNAASKDGRYYICKECCKEKSRLVRRRKGVKERKKPPRKQTAISKGGKGLSVVYESIANGCSTRSAIKQATQLGWDEIGEALVELIWNCKAVRIVDRKFVLVGSESKAA